MRRDSVSGKELIDIMASNGVAYKCPKLIESMDKLGIIKLHYRILYSGRSVASLDVIRRPSYKDYRKEIRVSRIGDLMAAAIRSSRLRPTRAGESFTTADIDHPSKSRSSHARRLVSVGAAVLEHDGIPKVYRALVDIDSGGSK
jgi:hypothetical protein